MILVALIAALALGASGGPKRASVRISSLRGASPPAPCVVGPNLLLSPGNLTNGAWTAFGNGTTAPIVTANFDTAPDGTHTANRVRFAVVGSGQESTLYQRVTGDQCTQVSCGYSIYLRSTPGGLGPSSGTLPVANAQNGNDGADPQLCAFTPSWTRCVVNFANDGTQSWYWLGYAAYAGSSGPGPAMDLELWQPKAEIGVGATPSVCPSPLQGPLPPPPPQHYIVSIVTRDWGITARDGAGLVTVDGGNLVLLGGWNDSAPAGWNHNVTTNEVYTSPDNGVTWNLTLPYSDNPPQDGGVGQRWRRRHSEVAFVSVQGGTEYIYVIGGDEFDSYYGSNGDGFFIPPNDVWRSADQGNTWSEVTPDAGWGPRTLEMGWTLGSTIYVAGGQRTFTDKNTTLNDVWYSTNGGSFWTELTPDAGWPPRGSIANSLPKLNGQAWMMGGQQYDNGPHTYFNDVWSFDGGTWTEVLPDAPWVARGYQNELTFDNRLWVFRGTSPAFLNDAWWSLNGVDWVQNPWNAGTEGHAGSAVVTASGNQIVMCGDLIASPLCWAFSK